MTTSWKKNVTAMNLMAMRKKERNYGGLSGNLSSHVLEYAYHIGIETRRSQDLLLRYEVKSRHPAEEGVGQLGQDRGRILVFLPGCIQRGPSRSQDLGQASVSAGGVSVSEMQLTQNATKVMSPRAIEITAWVWMSL